MSAQAKRVEFFELVDRAREAGMRSRRLPAAIKSLLAGNTIKETARITDINMRTARKLFRLFKDYIAHCGCGRLVTHSGWCAYRLEQADKPKNFVNAKLGKARRRADRLATSEQYLELVQQAQSLLPPLMPPHIRDEMLQEIIICLLEGREPNISLLSKEAFMNSGDYNDPSTRSIEEPIYYDVSLKDTLQAPERFEEHPDPEVFDFETHCFACGERGHLRRVHGHTQCENCGANVEPCCD